MSYGAKTAMAVYEAHEEDYDFDQYGQLLRPSPARPTSDTPDNVYWDDNSLLDSWAAALLDFKFKHPGRFAPLQQAPMTAAHKSRSAPLWYGPYNASAITSTNKSTANDRKRKATPNKLNEIIKKSKSTPVAGVDSMETDIVHAPPSPSWTPTSPNMQPSSPPPHLVLTTVPAIATASRPTPIQLPPPHLLPPSSLLSPPSTVVALPSLAPAAAPRTYPAPPPIVDIEPGLAPSTTESPEELLQDALWAWYNAGYQTALYHSAMGAIPGVDAS